jgi:hypothetical protein
VVIIMLSVCLLLAILNSIADPTFLWVLLPIVLAVDFLSGFVHWFFDTQVKPSTSFFGRIAIDFLDHHVRPERTAEVGFFTSAWRPALFITLPLTIASWAIPMPIWLAATFFWTGYLSMLVPQTHKEAHLGKRPPIITVMQGVRLIVNPRSHQAHHDDNRKSFCVFTGWLNPLLDHTGFWRVFVDLHRILSQSAPFFAYSNDPPSELETPI